MSGLLADLLHATRLYRKLPVSSLIAVAVLAATMAVLTAFLALWSDLALKQHAGFERAGELATVMQSDGQQLARLSYMLVERIDEESSTIDSITGVSATMQYIDRDGEREPVDTELVTWQFFPSLRPSVQLGRSFTAEDHDRNAPPVTILSHDAWQRLYGGQDNVLGRTLRVYGPNVILRTADGEARPVERWQDYRIVGVMGRELSGTLRPGVAAWMPFEQAAEALHGAAGVQGYLRAPQLHGIARLARGVDTDAVRSELRSRYGESPDPGIAEAPGMRFDAIAGVVRDANVHRSTMRQTRLFLAGSVLLALVAGCNISLYLLSRAPGRQRELAIRIAVGARLRRLARQLVTESALLVVGATVMGMLASIWLTVLVRDLPFLRGAEWRDISPFDWRVLAILAAIALLLTVLVSLAPIGGLRRVSTAAGAGDVSTRAGPAQRLAGIAQAAVASVIAGVALAFAWYSTELARTDTGFSARDVYVVNVEADIRSISQDGLHVEREHRRNVIASIPGVDAVAFGSSVPGQYRRMAGTTASATGGGGDTVAVTLQTADAAYFELIGASLREGRLFDAGEPTSIIVNEALARRVFGRTDGVVGEILPLDVPPGALAPRWEIAGVVRDIAFTHPSENAEPLAFQAISGLAAFEHVLIESGLSAAQLQRALQEQIDDGELQFAIASIARIDDLWRSALGPDRARTVLTAGIALIVMILAGFGFFGTQRFLVAAGRREYAIRASVGAGPRSLARLVLVRGFMLGLPGLLLGSVLTFLVVAWMRDDFLSTTVSPAVVAFAVAAVIAALLLSATLGPTRMARNTEPAPLLREE